MFPTAVPAIRLLLLTGYRKNEIATLRWDDLDRTDRTEGVLRIRDGKTGYRRVPLTPAVQYVLVGIPRIAGNPWVIAGQKRGDRLKNLDAIWAQLRERAGLDDVRIHDCRHSYASRAPALGEALPMIGRLLGHTQVETTARYAHLAEDSVKESAVRVVDSIAGDLLAKHSGSGIVPR